MFHWLRKGHRDHSDEELPITQHLEELRDRLLYSTIAIIICACVGFYYAFEIIAFMMYPLKRAMAGFPISAQLHFTSITEPLFQSFKIALFAGIGMAFPFWVWQLWKFVAPGLYQNEKKLVTPFVFSASLLFLAGTTFAYMLAVPLAYRFLLLYANPYYQIGQKSAGEPSITLEWEPVGPKRVQKHVQPQKRSSPTSQPNKRLQKLRTKLRKKLPPLRLKSSDALLPLRLEWSQKKGRSKGWQIKIKSALPANQMTPQTLLRELGKRNGIEFQLRRGKHFERYKIRYKWPKPKSQLGGGLLKPILTLQAYLSVSSWFLLGFGLIFQTPLLIILLTSSGVISVDTFKKYRRHSFVGILFISAVLTPTGDPVNLMIMAIPMYILFELGLWVSSVLKLKRQNSESDISTL